MINTKIAHLYINIYNGLHIFGVKLNQHNYHD